MLGRHHLLLSVFTAAILLMPYFADNTELFLLAIIGVGIGSLTPDADSQDAAIFHEKIRGVKGDVGRFVNLFIAPLLPLFGYTTKFAVYYPSVWFLDKTFLKKYNIVREHRGFLHSFTGISVASLLTLIYLAIILYFLGILNAGYLLIFIIAYIFGAIMHLLEDSCTVTGIQFSYPFSDLVLRGKLVTRPDEAKLPDSFMTILFIIVLALFFAIETKYLSYSDWGITLVSSISLVLIWFVFLVFIARVKFTHGKLQTYPNVKSLL